MFHKFYLHLAVMSWTLIASERLFCFPCIQGSYGTYATNAMKRDFQSIHDFSVSGWITISNNGRIWEEQFERGNEALKIVANAKYNNNTITCFQTGHRPSTYPGNQEEDTEEPLRPYRLFRGHTLSENAKKNRPEKNKRRLYFIRVSRLTDVVWANDKVSREPVSEVIDHLGWNNIWKPGFRGENVKIDSDVYYTRMIF